MSYPQAMQRLEAIVAELEHTEALSMELFRTKQQEAARLLAFCRQQLTDWETSIQK